MTKNGSMKMSGGGNKSQGLPATTNMRSGPIRNYVNRQAYSTPAQRAGVSADEEDLSFQLPKAVWQERLFMDPNWDWGSKDKTQSKTIWDNSISSGFPVLPSSGAVCQADGLGFGYYGGTNNEQTLYITYLGEPEVKSKIESIPGVSGLSISTPGTQLYPWPGASSAAIPIPPRDVLYYLDPGDNDKLIRIVSIDEYIFYDTNKNDFYLPITLSKKITGSERKNLIKSLQLLKVSNGFC